MFVTATSVGYGEVLVTTHFGRAIAICAGWLGMMLVALTTASLSNLLEWSSIEETANEFIRREILHDTRKLLAVGMIQRWWRVKLLELKVDQGQCESTYSASRVRVTGARHEPLALLRLPTGSSFLCC
jgi:hypothetical protein